MTTRRQLRRWSDSEVPPTSEPAPLPVQTTFRHMPASPAVATRVDAEAQKLRRYYDRITHCHVVILAPHRHHVRGRIYTVHIELGVPHDRLVINHTPAAPLRREDESKRVLENSAHQDIYVVIREAFDSARRRLEDFARRERGDVKHHASSSGETP